MVRRGILYYEPRTEAERRRERLAYLVLLATTVMLFIWLTYGRTPDAGEPLLERGPGCAAEDMVVVKVSEPVYRDDDPRHIAKGDLRCVHVDAFTPTIIEER